MLLVMWFVKRRRARIDLLSKDTRAATAEVAHERDAVGGLGLGVVEALARVRAVAVGTVEGHLLQVEGTVEVE